MAAAGILYPLGIYVAVTYPGWRGAAAAGVSATMVVALALLSPGGWRGRVRRTIPAVVLALAVLVLLAGRKGPALSVPVVVNGVLLVTFAMSLVRGQPIVEHFARAHNPTLSSAQVRYCRSVTIAWCVFFFINGGIAAALAVFASTAWWAVFTGGISYGLIGLMFAVEYTVRAVRFPASVGWLGARMAALLDRFAGAKP
jgi:uncharacterized membrane protein